MANTANCCDPEVDASLLSPSNVVLISAALLVDSDGNILISKRPKGKVLEGYWEFPGGKVEEGETPEAALVRELKEELGVKTCAGCLYPFAFASHRYEDFHLLMPVYVCRNWENIPVAQEGQELQWVKPREIMQISMPPANDALKTTIRDQL